MLSDILDLKKTILMAHRVRNVKMLNRAKFRGNRSKHDRYIAIFKFQDSSHKASWIFKIWNIHGFSNLKFLTVGLLKRAELHGHAKFGQNRSKYGRDMAIFRFLKMAAAAILDFSNFKFLTLGRLKRVELHRRAKLGPNRSNCSEIWRFFYYSKWRPPPYWICKILKF